MTLQDLRLAIVDLELALNEAIDEGKDEDTRHAIATDLFSALEELRRLEGRDVL